jgi:hypothetical protein
MTSRDAKFLLHELLMIANLEDPDLGQASEGAIMMGRIEARPKSFTTSLIDGNLSIVFRSDEGPKRYRIVLVEAD